VDLYTIAITIVTLILLLRWKVNSTWLIAGGAMTGFLVSNIR
jgi:chromate transporter